MPRKIPGLDDKIVKSAAELFLSKGYQNVSMKDLASHAGTSVGNLYNYFPAKKDLFLAGRHTWLEYYGASIQKLLDETKGGKEELVDLLFMLLETMDKWSGLYEEFLVVAAKELSPEENSQLREKMKTEYRNALVAKMDAFLQQLSQKSGQSQDLVKGMGSRLTISLILTVKGLVQFHHEEKEVNRQFIRNLVEVFFGEANNSKLDTSQS